MYLLSSCIAVTLSTQPS